MATMGLCDEDVHLLLDPYCCLSPEDLVPERPDPLWRPSQAVLDRYGPLQAEAGPSRYSEYHDPDGLLPSYTIYEGDALDVLPLLEGQEVVHSVVTSVPYYGIRQYGERPEEIGWGSLEDYLGTLCDVFDAVPLHRRGSAWINIGDSRDKRGNLLGVPERFLLAMLDRGWMLADKVVWAKAVAQTDGTVQGNCMPEPAPARLNGNGHEVLYRFVRSRDHRLGGLDRVQDAWADTHAVAVARQGIADDPETTRYLPESLMAVATSTRGRVLPNVWRVPMGQTKKGHYAVFPPVLVERPIAMSSPLAVCTLCGSPRERRVVKVPYDDGRPRRRMGKYEGAATLAPSEAVARSGRQDIGRVYEPRMPVTTGWSACACGLQWAPGTVLDPFCGTSSVGYAALLMGRSFIGVDLYSEYCRFSDERCRGAIGLLRREGLIPSRLQR